MEDGKSKKKKLLCWKHNAMSIFLSSIIFLALHKPVNQQNRLKNTPSLIQGFHWQSHFLIETLKKKLQGFLHILSAIFNNIFFVLM